MSLYEIGVTGRAINDYLELTEGELTPEAEDIFDRLLREGPDKLEAASVVVRRLEAYQDECRAEEKRLADRRRSFEANAEKLKQRMGFALEAFGGKLKTAKVTLWMQQNPDTTAVDLKEGERLEDLLLTHPNLVRVKYELDKVACKVALAAGDELPPAIYVENNPGRRTIRIK
jgi:hypothetical protein